MGYIKRKTCRNQTFMAIFCSFFMSLSIWSTIGADNNAPPGTGSKPKSAGANINDNLRDTFIFFINSIIIPDSSIIPPNIGIKLTEIIKNMMEKSIKTLKMAEKGLIQLTNANITDPTVNKIPKSFLDRINIVASMIKKDIKANDTGKVNSSLLKKIRVLT